MEKVNTEQVQNYNNFQNSNYKKKICLKQIRKKIRTNKQIIEFFHKRGIFFNYFLILKIYTKGSHLPNYPMFDFKFFIAVITGRKKVFLFFNFKAS
jgi:hypothetical protein